MGSRVAQAFETASLPPPANRASGTEPIVARSVHLFMPFEVWSALAGALLISIALIGSFFRRLPLTTTMCYFAVGLGLGPLGFRLVFIDPVEQAGVIERLAEIAVIVSLFTAGLKLRLPLGNPLWWISARLAFGSMILTVGLVALALVVGLDAHWGAAILIGAILAPTDPVLASAVQVRRAGEDDTLRFSLTSEAGLNDGTAFPFVMLGLGLLGLHELGDNAWRWWTVDVGWAIVGGLAIGALFGRGAGELVLYLRRHHQEGFGYDEFLALGLIGLSYGVALLAHAYGFLAVFAAGVALRAVERRHTGVKRPPQDVLAAPQGASDAEPKPELHPEKAPAHLTDSVMGFNEQVERLIEVALVLCLGAMLSLDDVPAAAWWFIPLLLFVIRPIAVAIGLVGSPAKKVERALMAWLGIRGIGSVYYLMHAIGFGLSDAFSRQLVALVILTIAVSIVLHGITAAPLMRLAERHRG